jgi:hypothetical protein
LQVKLKNANTSPLSLANFVGFVVGFLNVLVYACGASSLPPSYPLKSDWYKTKPPANKYLGIRKLMKSIEEIILPNGLKLNIFDLSRDIAADTVKVEIAFKIAIDLKMSFFRSIQDYHQVKNIFGDKLVYEYTLERAFIKKEKCAAAREELINTFKNNSLHYLGTENFAGKFALSLLRDIKNNPYKYQCKADNET